MNSSALRDFTSQVFSQTIIVLALLFSISSTSLAQVVCSGTKTIWSPSDVPTISSENDPNAVELGVKFRSDVDGYLCGIRFYKGSANTGTHVGNLWTIDGQLLATATFADETPSGWQQVDFANPVLITANTSYMASYHAPVGGYSLNSGFFSGVQQVNPPLRALEDSASGGNGVYQYGSGGFPSNTYLSANYWVDVVFSETSGVDTTPPTVVPVTPVADATGVSLGTTVTATFSEAMIATSITASTFELRDPGNALVTASISYSGVTAILTPTSGPLIPNTTYTATVIGGASGVADLAGNPLASDMTWQFTTDAGDTTPPTVASMTPSIGATGVDFGTSVTATFDEIMDPASINASTFQLRASDNTLVTASVSYSGVTAILTPTNGLLSANSIYTATVIGSVAGVTDLAGNPLASDMTWQFTTNVGNLSNCSIGTTSIWSPSAVPTVSAENDTNAVELGVKFLSDVNGYICGIRFYKDTSNTGTHVGNLWTTGGQLLATATFIGETPSGWQQVDFSKPVQITANTTYVASYHAPVGRYSLNENYFAGVQYNNPPLHALEDIASGGNGVYKYGLGGFPNNASLAPNYWVDVVFSESSGADTTPPIVVSETPVADATGVSLGTTVTATFSEAMGAVSINGSTFELRDSSNALVTVEVSSTANTATLSTAAPLLANTTYTATISGGNGGVKDLAGNPLVAEFNWSFTTIDSIPDSTPPVVALIAPADGETVLGNITLAANATDNIGIQSVQFRLNGVDIGTADTTVPYNVNWDTTASGNGAYTLTVRARDLSGNETISSPVTVNVENGNVNDPSQVGQWSDPLTLPTVSVNLNLLHTGKVLLWAGEFITAANYGELWDPATNEITSVPNPFSNIFCTANVPLADGRLLVAGGHDKQNGILGLADANIFDPVSETWTSASPMTFRRWYPTLTTLGDGRAIITSGSENSETEFVEIPEIYDPVTNTWTQLTNAVHSVPQYPMMYLLPDGKLLQSNSTEHPASTHTLDIDTQQWSVVDSRVLDGGSGVMYLPGQIMMSGSASNDGATPWELSTATTYVLNMNDSLPAWRETASMEHTRTFHNLTALPDGTVLATSGSGRKDQTALGPSVYAAELWSPVTETWTTLADMQTPRIYHSTAVLLPDGRVVVSGSGNIPGGTDMLSLEIFSPPYLFKGPRPEVTAVPNKIQYGSTITVQSPDTADIVTVNLIRTGSATHNFDQNQRLVPLQFSQVGGDLEISVPTNSNLIPPGYYMLFLVNSSGVPSIGEFVRFPAPYEDTEAPSIPANLIASGSVGAVNLSWDPSIDDTGVAKYNVYRSTTQGFTASAATLYNESTTTTFADTGIAGTYYYLVASVDIDGNISTPSNESFATATADTVSPTVSLTSPSDGDTISGTVILTASATDNASIVGVQFMLDGVALGTEDTTVPYSYSWDTTSVANGPYTITVIARDPSNNSTQSSALTATVLNTQQQIPGLVAFYNFEEGNGLVVGDASGNDNTGTITGGAVWNSAGRFGGSLSFDGVDDWVTIADSNSLDLTGSMTLEAWVYPTVQSGWNTVILKENANGLAYALYAHDNASSPSGWGGFGTSINTDGNAALALNTWTHLGLTYDGSVLRLYQDGIEVGTKTVTGNLITTSQALRIGGNSIWGEYFTGRIDELRIYDRALTQAEIQADMEPPTLGSPTLTITSPQNNSTVTGISSSINYSTGGDLSEVGFVHFSLDGGAEVFDSSPNDGLFTITGVGPGLHTLDGYLARSDHSKIIGSDSATINFTQVASDTVPPTVVVTEPGDGESVAGIVSVVASANDDTNLASVQFLLDGVVLGTEDVTAPYSYSWDTATVANGNYNLTAIARDASDNSAESLIVTITVLNTQQTIPGLVAAYSFGEGGGTAVADESGNGNTGTISGATWELSGRFGSALSFDGINDWVTIADSASLDLTSGMTLEAWVYPTVQSGWNTVIMKEDSNGLVYTLYANDNSSSPSGWGRFGGSTNSTNVEGNALLPLNTWTHLGLTYDGSVFRLYQDGIEVGTQTISGNLATTSQVLRIGGNSVWGEYFSGLIDEVKLYNRELNATELQSSMNTPVSSNVIQPTRSSSIVIDTTARRVWVVNPDNDSITALNADTLNVDFEISVGSHPTSIALDAKGQVWVTCRDDDSIWVINAADGTIIKSLQQASGSTPVSIVFTPDGTNGYIANQNKGQIQHVDTVTDVLGNSLNIGSTPTALAISGDGKRLLVTRFISDDGAGTVWSIDLASFTVTEALDLPLDSTSQDGSLAARGLPNQLVGIAINPWVDQAWVVGKKDNIVRGEFRDGLALTFETTARALVSSLDLAVNAELLNQRLDIDNHGQPSSITFNEEGDRVFVTMQGNNRVIVFDLQGNEITRADTGLAPQGVAIDPVTNRVFTKDLMSRTITVFDGSDLQTQGVSTLLQLASISSVANEKMSSNILQGKQIFYNSADTRMSKDGYISCAGCHLDGGHDGRVWDFTDRGEGFRNTISLKGQGGDAGAPMHWSGNFDEVQDFEHDIRNAFLGSGFMDDSDFLVGTRNTPLGEPKAGISQELDALAAYVNSLTDPGRSPFRQPDGVFTAGAINGQILFQTLGCQSCHSGERFSDSNTDLRHDVGTIKPSSGLRLGGILDGIDTPTLLGLWASAPYLHDGSAVDLKEVLTTENANGLHSDIQSLSPAELDQLVEYLLQIENNLP